jgi:hypothetical protein
MTPDRKKPSAGFWITVALVAVLVGYPLSWGPAVWLVRKGALPRRAVYWTYRPLGYIVEAFPLREQFRISLYLAWWEDVSG